MFLQVVMSSDAESTINEQAFNEQAFLREAAANGLDTSDQERMADLRSRVALMRQGLARVYEIDVSGAESPSIFIPVRK
jgi:aminoglycoside phosphotransferase